LDETVIVDPNGRFQGYETLNSFGCLFFNPKMSDAKFRRLLSILDYVASDEGQDYIRLGFEGRDYTRTGGNLTITREKGQGGTFVDIHTKYPGAGVYSHVTICPDAFAARDPAIPASYFVPTNAMYATKQKLGVDTGTLRPYNYELAFFGGPNYLKFSAVDIGQELTGVALMQGDLRTNYDRWLRDTHAVVDPVLKELNDAYGK
jgi:putative aldouronate transport system substrate-binding protein